MNDVVCMTKAHAPIYLQSSPVLESWEDSDEPVSVSAAVLKMDTTIANPQDLDHLLATLRYWIVSDLPFSTFEYVLADSTGSCAQVLRKFERDLQTVACLLKLATTHPDQRWIHALQAGDLNCVRYLFENGLTDPTTDCCFIVAGAGSVPCLEYLRSKGCAWSSETCNAAVKSGHLLCLRYLHAQGCPWTSDACSIAAENGHLDCLKYLHEKGCEWTSEACNLAAQNGHLKCLKYLHEHGCEWGWRVCDASARSGHAACLVYAVQRGCLCNRTTVLSATAHGQVHILRLIRLDYTERRWMEKIVECAAKHGQIEVLKYLRTINVEVSYAATAYAAFGGQLACLKWLHETGCAWSLTTTTMAAMAGHLGCLKYAVEHGCAVGQLVYTSKKTPEITEYALSLLMQL